MVYSTLLLYDVYDLTDILGLTDGEIEAKVSSLVRAAA